MAQKPGPRARNAKATQQAILVAAMERFTAESYDDVGIRDIAGDAGVDSALISRYFGSKEDLFLEVLDATKKSRDMTDGPRETFGMRIAREVIFDEIIPCDGDLVVRKMQGLLVLLRAISSTKAMEVVQKSAEARYFGPLTQWIGGEDAAIRARLVASLIMGMAIGRELSGGYADLNNEQKSQMMVRMAEALQALVDN